MRNKIYAIVEGQGEAKSPSSGGQPAIIVLISKLLTELQYWNLFPAKSFRMSYGQFFRGDKFENAIRYHKLYGDCVAVLVLLDMDDDCPKEKAYELTTRINQMEELPFSVAVVCAKREYETWFLASLETIHHEEVYEGDPEARRDAKGWLRQYFGYKPTRHQASYTERLDIASALNRTRSFRRLYHAFQEIIEAHQSRTTLVTPAPE